MYDYFDALQQNFYREPDCPELKRKIKQNYQALRQQMNREQRKMLLRIIDTENALRDESSLAAFIAGFRLAREIEMELRLTGRPSVEGDGESETVSEGEC